MSSAKKKKKDCMNLEEKSKPQVRLPPEGLEKMRDMSHIKQ
jgi:hypothetical protein